MVLRRKGFSEEETTFLQSIFFELKFSLSIVKLIFVYQEFQTCHSVITYASGPIFLEDGISLKGSVENKKEKKEQQMAGKKSPFTNLDFTQT